MRRIAKILLVSVAFIIAVAGAVLTTHYGQFSLLRFAVAMAGGEQARIHIAALQGSLFSNGLISEITVADQQGVWLKARNIAFSWQPSALLFGRLVVSYLRVENVAILRQPVAGPQQRQPTGNSIFALPVKVAIGEFNVKVIDVSPQVSGEPARVQLKGSANLNSLREESTAVLWLERVDGQDGAVRADLAYRPSERSLELIINGSEAEGGMVSSLLNLPDRPALAMQLNGRGRLDAWMAEVSATAAGKTFLAGIVRLDADGEQSHHLSAQFSGYVQQLLPRGVAEFAGGKSQLNLAADLSGLDGSASRMIRNLHLDIANDALRLTAFGGGDLHKGFVHGRLEGSVGRKDGTSLRLSGANGAFVSMREAKFDIALPDTRKIRTITVTAEVSGLQQQQIRADKLTLVVSAVQPRPAGPQVKGLEDVKTTLRVTGIDQATPAGAALGQEVRATLEGSYDGRRLTVSAFGFDAEDAKVSATGNVEGHTAQATAQLSFADLSRYSAVSGMVLKGHAAAEVRVDGNLSTDALSLALTGESVGVATGIDSVDRLLAPTTKYVVHAERSADGTFALRETSLTNALVDAQLNGSRAPGSMAFTGKATLAGLASVSPTLAGSASLTFDVSGQDDDLSSKITVTGKNVTLNGKPLKQPKLQFAGRGARSKHAGTLTFHSQIANEDLAGRSRIVLSDTGATLFDILRIDLAGARIAGNLNIAKQALPTGRIEIYAPELARLARATGFHLTGRVRGSVKLEDSVADFDLTGDDLNVAGVGIDALGLTGKVSNYASAPLGAIDLKAKRIAQGSTAVRDIVANVRFDGGRATFASNGHHGDAAFALAGGMDLAGDTRRLEVKSATYAGRSGLAEIRLPAPAEIMITAGQVSSTGIQLLVGTGTLRIDGTAAADALDARLSLKNIPASIASVGVPELGLTGVISGEATVKGSPSDPRVVAKIMASGVSVAKMRAHQLPAVDVATDIVMAEGRAKLNVQATARGGFDLSADATVGMAAGADITASAKGNVPLAMADVILARRAARAEGQAAVTAKISGSISDPRVDGKVTIRDGRASDPPTGLHLSGIELDAAFTQNEFIVQRLAAVSKQGGSLNLAGTASLLSGANASVDATLKLTAFRFGNQAPVAGEIDADVKIVGPLALPEAGGQLRIRRMDITVPNQLPKSVQSLEIRHVNAPARFKSGKKVQEGGDDAHASAMKVSLALDVTANDRIFVRGRGVDAQLGGFVKIRGTADKPYTDGKFSMSRGRLSIIGRQLNFSRGNILFYGSPEPSLDMEAAVDADGTTITVNVTGPASKPRFKFSSSPELPEDEIVSVLLFNKKLAALSPTQLIQLANEIDKIGGLSSGPGALENMKRALGIDVLDVTTDEQGKAQATAGSYINGDTYVGVNQGAEFGKTRIIIDHNLTKNFKARGEVGASGDSKLGVGFEWDY